MSGNPRENVKDKGFWDGGAAGHGTNKETGGRPSGTPGSILANRTGHRIDLEFPSDSDLLPVTPSVPHPL